MDDKSINSPSLWQAAHLWAKIGLLSFGGPSAQIALMHREVIEERGWMDEKQFLSALSFCMLLPGPEAMQLVTYIGWRLHGWLGGLLAGLLFILPGAMVILLFAMLYTNYGEVPFVQQIFLGVKAAIVIIVLEALLRVSKRALKTNSHWIIAALSFIAIFFFALPYPILILMAAFYGFLIAKPKFNDHRPSLKSVSSLKSLATVTLWLGIWWLPLVIHYQIYGDEFLKELALFFSKLAVVTFGGAYSVLAYMAQDVVNHHGWLNALQMMDGLGLAETTPGPLILVTEFVGYLAAYAKGGFWYGILGAVVTLWVTFVPCFLWIFSFAPYMEWISNQPRLDGALQAITASVVGVILNLSIWFALHVLFQDISTIKFGFLNLLNPNFSSIDVRVIILSLISALLLFKFHLGIGKLIPMIGLLAIILSNLI